MPSYARLEGILIEAVGHLWAAYSPASGETALLNDESAALLELLEAGPLGTRAIAGLLANDIDADPAALSEIVEAAWPTLVESGLVRRFDPGHISPQ